MRVSTAGVVAAAPFKAVPWVVCSGNVGEVGAPSLPDPLLSGSGVLAGVGCLFLPPARGGLFSLTGATGKGAAWAAGGTWAAEEFGGAAGAAGT